MMRFNSFSSDGRTLLVKFTCLRCGKEHIDPLEAHKDDDPESYGHLHSIKPPKGWDNLLIHGPLLCPECLRAYALFMRNGKEEPKQ